MDIYGTLIDANNNIVVNEFRINTLTNSAQYHPEVDMNDEGESVVVWRSQGQYRAQRFSLNASPVGDELLVNTSAESLRSVAVAINSSKCFMVAWWDLAGLYGRVFNQNLAPVGDQFLLDDNNPYGQKLAISALPSGEFIVVWVAYWEGIFFRIFNSSGDPVSAPSQLLHPDAASSIDVGVDSEGRVVIVWDAGGIWGMQLDSSFESRGTAFLIDPDIYSNGPKVVVHENGLSTVVWDGRPNQSENRRIVAQMISASGELLAGNIIVDTDEVRYSSDPSIARLSNGGFIAVWTDYSEIDGDDVYRVMKPVGP